MRWKRKEGARLPAIPVAQSAALPIIVLYEQDVVSMVATHICDVISDGDDTRRRRGK